MAVAATVSADDRPFTVRVVDGQTGRGVPIVELETVHHVLFWTDSAGVAAIDEPGLAGRKVFLSVRSHGYEFPRDGLGFAGTAVEVKPGTTAELRVRRLNIAERLYRVTGAGIYRDSVLAGAPAPIREPLLNAQVLGQDSVQAVPYGGTIRWFWGDTNRVRHPLGLFRVAGAVSDPPGKGGLDPAVGVDLRYVAGPDGFCRAMCPLPGEGPVWIDGLAVVPDEAGRERMVAHYARMKNLGEKLEHGIAVWNDATETFEKRTALDLQERWRFPRGQAVRVKEADGEYVLFAAPFPVTRVRAGLAHVLDPAAYEAFTCVGPSTLLGAGAAGRVERDAGGRPAWRWRADAGPLDPAEEAKRVESGALKAEEAHFQPRPPGGGAPVRMHAGSVRWNGFRKRWVMIAVETGGTSFLGEVWYAEAEAPTGPWTRAVKVVTHDRYSFYNPVHHAFFDGEGGRIIYFEGTYAATFSGAPAPTPRYDYNQVMYRLDLADPRLGERP